jgi:hypothetical protein
MRKSLDGYVPSPLFEAVRRAPRADPAESGCFWATAGRCGMNWFHRILASTTIAPGDASAAATSRSFFRYFHYHGLPVDLSGFHELLAGLRNHDGNAADISVIYSPYFDFGMSELVRVLNPDKVFFHIRKPEDAINSMWVKGWYRGDYVCRDPAKAPGTESPDPALVPPQLRTDHAGGEMFEQWRRLTRIGRIAWFYVEANTRMLAQHTAFGGKAWTVKLGDVDQNYEYYRGLADCLGLRPRSRKRTSWPSRARPRTRACPDARPRTGTPGNARISSASSVPSSTCTTP